MVRRVRYSALQSVLRCGLPPVDAGPLRVHQDHVVVLCCQPFYSE
jgi:hypothetical protein